jgi:putative transposase
MSHEPPVGRAADSRELQKLGLEISPAAVSQDLGRRSTPPSQTWRTFLDHHLQTLVSVDFVVVPTVLFKVLFVFVVLAHERRRVVHINVTDSPTAQWTAQQLVEAFPWATAPRYLLRDRDAYSAMSGDGGGRGGGGCRASGGRSPARSEARPAAGREARTQTRPWRPLLG